MVNLFNAQNRLNVAVFEAASLTAIREALRQTLKSRATERVCTGSQLLVALLRQVVSGDSVRALHAIGGNESCAEAIARSIVPGGDRPAFEDENPESFEGAEPLAQPEPTRDDFDAGVISAFEALTTEREVLGVEAETIGPARLLAAIINHLEGDQRAVISEVVDLDELASWAGTLYAPPPARLRLSPSGSGEHVAAVPPALAKEGDGPVRDSVDAVEEIADGLQYPATAGHVSEGLDPRGGGSRRESTQAPYRVLRTVDRAGKVRRELLDIDECELIAGPVGDRFADFASALSYSRDSQDSFFPPPTRFLFRQDEALIFLAKADGGWQTLGEWCANFSQNGGYPALAQILVDAVRALSGLHSTGFVHGSLTPERLVVDPTTYAVRLAWPLMPQPIGQEAQNAKGALGYICPEFGFRGSAAEPSWDLFALASCLFWGVLSSTAPTWLSDARARLPNPRVYVPQLPPGWGALFARLLARDPSERFATCDELDDCLKDLAREEYAYRLTCAAALHPGVGKVQQNPRNQDRCFLVVDCGGNDHWSLFDQSSEQGEVATADIESAPPLVAGICDGVSTAESGELAAVVLAETMSELSREVSTADPGLFLATAFDRANAELGEQIANAAKNAEQQERLLAATTSPASTMVALILANDNGAVAGVGDSRVYLLRTGLLDQLTVDGDQLTTYLREGLAPDEAVSRDDYKMLTTWAGSYEIEAGGKSAQIQPQRPIALSDRFSTFTFRPCVGDIYCCCSDGVSDYVDAGLIDLRKILETCSPAEACRTLVAEANECGGNDNISVVVTALLPCAAKEERGVL